MEMAEQKHYAKAAELRKNMGDVLEFVITANQEVAADAEAARGVNKELRLPRSQVRISFRLVYCTGYLNSTFLIEFV